jgi:protein PhnA
MSLEKELIARSGGSCELCAAQGSHNIYEIPPQPEGNLSDTVWVCSPCLKQIEGTERWDAARWNCLSTAMWSEYQPVKVLAWRLLQRCNSESWATDALDMLYLTDEELHWAKATGDEDFSNAQVLHADCNGTPLLQGDAVVLIKTLDVKGSSLQAKVGTAVKNIRLVQDNPDQIEGKIDGQQIVILTKYVRKS